jgi:hypothetical protein
MAVTEEYIQCRLSGGDLNTQPPSALGGVMSESDITDAALDNLFDLVDSSEASAGDTEYRCYYIYNTHPTDSILTLKVFIEEETPSSDTVIDIGLDPAGVGDGKTTGVATTIANEGTAPSAVSFSHPTTYAGGLNIGTLAAGEAQAIWVRRTVSSSATAAPIDQAMIRHEGSDS